MKISTKGRYALRLMIDLGEHQNAGYVTLKDIASRQNISKKYLEQIIPVLNKSGLLKTSRGFQGGYQLARAPKEYTVGEILRLTEGNLAPVSCLDCDVNNCERAGNCPTLNMWKGLYEVIIKYLESVTLQDLLDKQNNLLANDYVI
ncbi:MAG: Rrf2 family transcriptional regulator [Succinivibrio sp.]|nr:Rrf2 family transcriptional regulator [Succinivibrio sp.]MBR1613716.1 Rrf2 family transcriptional regulator [Succinivibrio sp.]